MAFYLSPLAQPFGAVEVAVLHGVVPMVPKDNYVVVIGGSI
jgi:hypothetical protein